MREWVQWVGDKASQYFGASEDLDSKEMSNDEIANSIVENSLASEVEIKKIEDKVKAYEDMRPWILSALNTTLNDIHILKADGMLQGVLWFVSAAAKDPAGHINGMTGATSLGMLLVKETGVGVSGLASLFNSTDGILKLISSPTVGKMLQDEEIWKLFLLKQDKIIEYLETNQGFLDSWKLKKEDVKHVVPSLLLVIKELSKNLAANKDQVAEFIGNHKDLTIDEKFLRDGVGFAKVAQMAAIVQENGHLKKDFMVVAAALLPFISTTLKDKARIYIPQLSGSEVLGKVEAIIPGLVADIASDIPGMFNPSLEVQNHAMREITRKALSMDLTEVAKALDAELLAKYLADVSESLKTVKDKNVAGMVYVESYVAEDQTREKVAIMLKRLLPKIKELAPEILKLYDFAMLTKPAVKEDTQKMLEGGFAIAKELTSEELEMVVRIEVERYMSYPTSKYVNDLFPVELRSELMPFVSKLVHDAIQKDVKPVTAEYLTKFFHGEVLAADFTFDLIDLFMDGLNKKEVGDKYYGFFNEPKNKENLEQALKKMLLGNPQLKGKERQIVDILSDPQKMNGLAGMYKAFRDGNYGKLTFQVLGAVVLPWRDSDIRGTIVFVAFNYIRSFVIDNLYPAFIRNKIFGKFANDVVNELVSREEGVEPVKLKEHLHSKVTVDSKLSFRKEHFISSGSFRGLDINTEDLKNISFEGLNLADCVFGAKKISYCSFVNTNLNGAEFKKVTELETVMFDLHSAKDMLHSIRKGRGVRINMCEIKLESGESLFISDNKIVLESTVTLTPKEYELLSAALKDNKLVTMDEENRKKLVVDASDKSKSLTADEITSIKLADRDGIMTGKVAAALLEQMDKKLNTQGKSTSVA